MPWDMIMSLPIQDRRYFIMRHNMEQDAFEHNRTGGSERRYEGEAVNAFARNEQSNRQIPRG